MKMDSNSKKIILSTNLRGFFFEGLSELNKKSLCPIPESVIFYSSDVLDKFALSDDYFETSEGKIREKILGMKLLEATQFNRDEQRRVYKEVGDMALLVCGYFSESINKKIVDTQYYSQIGKTAYSHLNNISPQFLDIPHFFGIVSTCFESMATLLSILATKNGRKSVNSLFEKILRDESMTETEKLMCGVVTPHSNKAS